MNPPMNRYCYRRPIRRRHPPAWRRRPASQKHMTSYCRTHDEYKPCRWCEEETAADVLFDRYRDDSEPW